MLTEFIIKKLEPEFTYLKNNKIENIKIKTDNLPKNLKEGDKLYIDFFKEKDLNKKSLEKKIINEILNTQEEK